MQVQTNCNKIITKMGQDVLKLIFSYNLFIKMLNPLSKIQKKSKVISLDVLQNDKCYHHYF